jgi:hypothetical protein
MQLRGRVRAACASGLVLFLALGVVGTVAGPAPAQPDDRLAAAGDLAGFIPEAVRYACWIDSGLGPAAFGVDVASVRVGLRCPGTDGVDFVEYFLFSSNAAMNRAYKVMAGTAGSDAVRSTAGNCPSEGSWDFSGRTAGRVACYYTTQFGDAEQGLVAGAETAVRLWTYDAQDIVGVAAMPQGNTDAVTLRTWWNDKAGPLEKADDVSDVVASGDGQAQFERALRARIPAATRKTCRSIDPTDPQANAADYSDRLWVRAAVRCEPTSGGADFVVYQSIAPAAVDGFFASYVASAKAQARTATRSSNCPDSGTWSQGRGAKKRVVGEFACAYYQTSDGVEDVEYGWSHRKLGTVAYAVNLNDDPSAVVRWWNSNASGPQ